MKINPPSISINQQAHTPPTASDKGYWNIAQDNSSPSAQVTLSDEGKALSQAESTKDFGYALKQPNDSVQQVDTASEQEKKGDILDEQIKRVQEQIKETQQKIAALQGQDTEEAREQIKILTGLLMELNAQLISLNEQKLQKAKQEQANS